MINSSAYSSLFMCLLNRYFLCRSIVSNLLTCASGDEVTLEVRVDGMRAGHGAGRPSPSTLRCVELTSGMPVDIVFFMGRSLQSTLVYTKLYFVLNLCFVYQVFLSAFPDAQPKYPAREQPLGPREDHDSLSLSPSIRSNCA